MADGKEDKNFLDVEVNPANANLDIVAVHGLNPFSQDSNAYSTWIAEENGEQRNWLTEARIEGFLPTRFPTARVMIFGYNSNAVFKGSNATVNEHAENLLTFLRQERRRLRAPGRPIVLICHSLGGLLVKRALIMAHNMNPHKDIYESTKGVVFFATPHGGSDKVRIGSIAATIAQTLLNQPDSRYLESLAQNSLCAQTNRRDFLERSGDFKFLSVIETRRTRGVQVVEMQDATLNLPSDKETRIFQDTDHIQICRFWNPNSRTFKAVLDEIEDMVDIDLHSNAPLESVSAAGDLSHDRGSVERSETSDKFRNHEFRNMETSQPGGGPDGMSRGHVYYSVSPGLARRVSNTPSEVDILVPGSSSTHVLNMIIMSRNTNAGRFTAGNSQELSQTEWFLPTFLKSFNHYDYRAGLEEISEAKDPYTCHWIFHTKEIEQWIQCRNNLVQILWFTGHPGIGKSTLASHMVEKLQDPEQSTFISSSMVIYSFCHYQNNYTPSMVLSVAIHQILYKYPGLQQFAFSEDIQECLGSQQNRIMKAKHRSSWTLWRLFNALINNVGVDIVYFVVDGFNLLEEAAQRDLLNRFCLRSQVQDSKTRLKIFITSLPSIHTRRLQLQWNEKCPGMSYSMDATQYEDQFNRDIEDLISRERKKIQMLQGHLSSHLDMIDRHLATYQHKSFLPIKLYFKQLEVNPPDKVGEILLHVSQGLSNFYKKLVSKLPSELLLARSSLVTFVTYAFTTLEIQELAFMRRWEDYGVAETSPFAAEETNPIDSEYNNYIKIEVQRYFPILKIRGEQVSFFHDSIREYIMERALHEKDFLLLGHKEAHTQLALLCMKTILYKSNLQVPEQWERGATLRLDPAKHVFLSYAMQFWLKHLQEAVPDQTPVEEISKNLLTAVRDVVQLWSSSSSAKDFREVMLTEFKNTHKFGNADQDLTPLEVLSALGLEPFLRLYLALPNTLQRLNNSATKTKAINLAIAGGHSQCLAVLRKAFNVTSLDGQEHATVILDSARSGQPLMLENVLRLRRLKVQELVQALIAAFLSGEDESLDELAKDHSLFLIRDHFGMNALHALFAYKHRGFEEIHSISRTQVSFARIKASIAICGYLMENGISISSEDNFGFTALHWACSSPHFCKRAIIEYLVSRGANVHHRSITGLTALHVAAYHSESPDELACLLELGTKELLGVASRGRMTPLHWAITRRDGAVEESTYDILEFLLRQGADILAENLRGITVLEWGACHRRVLLQKLYSSLEGVDLISISYHPDADVTNLWAAWSDMSPDQLDHMLQVVTEENNQFREGQNSAPIRWRPSSIMRPPPIEGMEDASNHSSDHNLLGQSKKSFRDRLKRFRIMVLRRR